MPYYQAGGIFGLKPRKPSRGALSRWAKLFKRRQPRLRYSGSPRGLARLAKLWKGA